MPPNLPSLAHVHALCLSAHIHIWIFLQGPAWTSPPPWSPPRCDLNFWNFPQSFVLSERPLVLNHMGVSYLQRFAQNEPSANYGWSTLSKSLLIGSVVGTWSFCTFFSFYHHQLNVDKRSYSIPHKCSELKNFLLLRLWYLLHPTFKIRGLIFSFKNEVFGLGHSKNPGVGCSKRSTVLSTAP